KIFGVTQGLLPRDERLDKLSRYVTLETGLIVGGLFFLLGLGGAGFAIGQWALAHFGPLDPVRFTRLVVPSLLSLTLGLQITLSSFFLSLLGLAKR
ncbi:MAG: glycosyltransferase family 2 protein, partial [Acidobacteriia bacterium]|nr:glycosyltransferase family 2 protein [Terriglobia bacterium]